MTNIDSRDPDLFVSALESLLDNTADIMFIKDSRLRYRGVSAAYAALLGFDDRTAPENLTDRDIFANKALAERYAAEESAVLTTGASIRDVIEPLIAADGTMKYISMSKFVIRGPDGSPGGIYGIGRDVTRYQEEKMEYERKLKLLTVLAPDILITALFDLTSDTVVSRRFRDPAEAELFSLDTVTAFKERCAESIAEDEELRALFHSLNAGFFLERFNNGQKTLSADYLRTMADGSKRWVRDESQLLTDPDSGHLMMLLCLRDIDSDRRRINALTKAADTDAMTGLYNHDAALKQIETFLSGEGAGGHHAVFMVDVDNFKAVNDTLGHRQGDTALKNIARAMRLVFRQSDILGRVGGDEFLVLMKNVSAPQAVHRKAAELLEALQFTFSDGTTAMQVSSSIGISISDADGKSVEQLYTEADTAMYAAKALGKNRYSICNEDEGQAAEAALPGRQWDSIQLQTLLENMDGGVLIAEVTDRVTVTYASPSMLKALDGRKAYLRPQDLDFRSIIHSEDISGLRAAVFKAAAEKTPLDQVCRTLEDGSPRWKHIRGSLLPELPGKPPRLICVVTDITQMMESATQLEAIVQNAPCGIATFEVTDKLRPLFVNGTLLNLLGCTRQMFDQLTEDDAYSLILERDREAAKAELNAALSENRPAEYVFRTSICSVPGLRIMSIRAVKLYEQNGNPVVIMMYSDVTRESVMENRLHFSESRIHAAMGLIGHMLWEMDLTGNEPDTETALKPPPSPAEVHPESGPEYARMLADIADGQSSGDYFMRTADGKGGYSWHKYRYALICGDDGRPVHVVGLTESVAGLGNEMTIFERESRFARSVQDMVLGQALVNLSRNRVESAAVDGLIFKNGFLSYANLLKYFLRQVPDADRREQLAAAWNCGALAADFNEGRNLISEAFRRRDKNGRLRWTTGFFRLMRHPLSGALYAFVYVRDSEEACRRERTLPCSPERDFTTLLYSKSTFEALVESILSAFENGSPCEAASSCEKIGFCAMSMLRFDGLGRAGDIGGIFTASDIMFTIGRLVQIMAESEAIVGCYDEKTVMAFRLGVRSEEEQQQRVARVHKKVLDTLFDIYPEEKPVIVTGLALAPAFGTNCPTLLEKARSACRLA